MKLTFQKLSQFDMDEMKNKILEEYKRGNIVFLSFEGLNTANIKEFMNQPVKGLLYDLNRDEATVLTFIENENG